MENVEQGTYLWGVLLTERSPDGPPAVEYLPFVSWDLETSTGELDAFERFWGGCAVSVRPRLPQTGRSAPTASASQPRTARCGELLVGSVSRTRSRPS